MRRQRRPSDERGASMVEAAIVLPILVLLIFGVVEFGLAFNAKVTLTHAAREGVREYALNNDLGAATDKVKFAADGLDPALLGVSATACVDGDQTELTVQYPYSYDIPFWGSSTFTMESKGVMRCSG